MLRKVILGENCSILHGKGVRQQSAGKTSLFQRRDVSSYRSHSQALLRAHFKEHRCSLCGKRIIDGGEGVSSRGVEDLWRCPLPLISLSCISELCTQLVKPCFAWQSWAEQMGKTGDGETINTQHYN